MIRDGKSSNDTNNFIIKALNEAEKICKERDKYRLNKGTKDEPLLFCITRNVWDKLVEQGLYENYEHIGNDLFYFYGDWYKICILETSEGKYTFNDNGTITRITETHNSIQKQNKENFKKFAERKVKKK